MRFEWSYQPLARKGEGSGEARRKADVSAERSCDIVSTFFSIRISDGKPKVCFTRSRIQYAVY